ncbi:MAG: hypothetical protein O3C49_03620 [Proteobacteria bacterium]|nr:hypothetical protein [Pseudomonadota bacterium]
MHRLTMAAIALAASAVLLLPQPSSADGKDHSRSKSRIRDVQETLGPKPAPGNHIQQQINGLKQQLDLIAQTACLALDEAKVLALPPGYCSRISFVTSTRHLGDFGGLAGADAICNSLAQQGRLPGTYLAWLSSATGSPSERFTRSALPYINTGSALVANDYADLTDGKLLNAIEFTETGEDLSLTLPPPHEVFTGTSVNGLSTQKDCSGWSSVAIPTLVSHG